jgi:hypothetical protein
MGQDATPTTLGADLSSLTEAFGEHEPKATTKASMKALQDAPARAPKPAAAPTATDSQDTGDVVVDDEDDEHAHANPNDDGEDDSQDTDDTDDEGDEDDGTVTTDDDGETFELKVNGETKKLTRAEVLEAASKGYSAHERWERASALHKHADGAIQQTNQHRAQLGHMLGVFQQQLATFIQHETPNLDELALTDPVQYVQQKALLEKRQQAFRQVEEARNHLIKQQRDADASRMQGFLAEQKDAVLETIPEWRDAEKAQKGVAKIATYLAEQGFNNEEISGITDARIVRVLHTALTYAEKARKYDELMAKGRTAQKRVQKLPPVVESPGARQPASSAKAEQRKRNVRAWEKNPNVDNLAKFF